MADADWIERVMGVRVAGPPVLVQELWSGFGAIERWWLEGEGGPMTVILKRIDGRPEGAHHPRGWGSSFGDARKRRSYAIERTFYRLHGARLGEVARLPRMLAERETETGGAMLLEDLDAAGFRERRRAVSDADVRSCIRWLAAFHAASLGLSTEGLWPRGTYWHLSTRPDELEAMEDTALRAAAPEIDARLTGARFQTFVHGDAKLANFCFSAREETAVAAVDFQYVGGGVGVQDLAYFLGSCLEDAELESRANEYLDGYFSELREHLETTDADIATIEAEWRSLWPYAWADFHRFLAGWAPGHWKMSSYSERMTRSVL